MLKLNKRVAGQIAHNIDAYQNSGELECIYDDLCFLFDMYVDCENIKFKVTDELPHDIRESVVYCSIESGDDNWLLTSDSLPVGDHNKQCSYIVVKI